MATSYKNIVITPNISNTSDPKIVFSGANATVNTDVTLFVYPDSNGTLSFEGSAGQLFSITNDLSNSLFSVNDVSGIPSVEVFANGLVSLIPTSGNVVFGNTTLGIIANTTGLYVSSNSTVNASHTAALVQVSNSTSTANLTASDLKIGATTVVNSTAVVATTMTGNISASYANISGQVNTATLYAITSANIASAVQANATGVWTTGTVNAASHTVGSNFIANATAIVGTGFANVTTSVNSALLTVGTSFIANTTGAYHTGTMNAASHTVGTSTIANSTGVYTGVVNGASHTVGTAFTANSTVVNAVSYYSGSLLVANTTVANATHLAGYTFAVPPVIGSSTANGISLTYANVTGQVNTATLYASGNVTVAGNVTSNYANTTLDMNVGRNLTVAGNLTITGTATVLQGNSLSLSDNMLYLNNGVLATITNISGSGTAVTFTANNNYQTGWDVTVTGVTPSSYNGTYLNITSANATHFVVANTNTDAYVSGGTARGKTEFNPDLGIAAGYNDGTYHHTGIFRDATDGFWKVFDNYDPEPDAAINIDTADASFHIADFWANTVRIGSTTTYSTINSTAFVSTGFVNVATSVNSALHTVGTNFIANSTAIVGTGYANVTTSVNSALLTVGTSFIANTTGAYHTGVVNAASHSVGSAFIANTTGAYHTGLVNAASHTVGSSFIANSTAIVGTGYANVTTSVNSALLTVGTSFIANTTGAYHTGTVNAASHTVGTSTIANSTGVYTGTVNAASHTVGTTFTANSTVVNAVSYYSGTLLVANSTVSNATHLGGIAETSFLRYRGSITETTLNDTTTDAARTSGWYTVSYTGASDALLDIGGIGGSTPRVQFRFNYDDSIWFRAARDTETTWDSITSRGKLLLHSSNYNSYAPTLTGTGASGTWGISITGTANIAAPAVLGSTTANGASLTYANVSGQVNTATLYATTSANIASAVQANATGVYTTGTVNAASHTVGTSTIANSTGVYTGTVNAASHTVGALFTANSTVVNAVSYYSGTLLVANSTVSNATHLGGTAASGYQTTAGLSANVAVLTSNNSTYINGNNVTTVIESLRANRNITGGGTITVDASYNVLWSSRFIVISNGRGTTFGTSGYFDITCPTSGTITGVGGATSKTATAAGIPLNAWDALYYILPIGSASTSVAANFRVVSYTADLDVPSEWVLICIRNGDNSVVSFNNGINLLVSQSYNTVTWSSTTVPAANNATNFGGYTWGAPAVLGGTTANGASLTYANVSGQVNTATLYATTSANIASAVQANATGVYTTGTVNAASLTVGTSTIANTLGVYTGIVNAASHTVGTSFIANSTAIVGTGYANVTTSVNSALLTVGTSFIANTTGAYHTGTVNAASHTVGSTFTANATLVNAAAINITGQVNTATLYVTTSANLAGTTTVANTLGVYTTGLVNAASYNVGTNFIANATAIVSTGFANVTTSVNSALLTVGTSFIANTTGAYHTGTMNAASHTIGSTLVANTLGVYHTGTMNAASLTVGATFTANATLVNAAAINITGQVNTATLYAATSANIASIVQANSLGIHVGANVYANTTAFDVGNTIITSTNAIFGGTIAANGGIGSAGQVLTSGAGGNVYWSTVSGGSGATASRAIAMSIIFG